MTFASWKELCDKLSEMFGSEFDLNGVLLLVGIREMEWPFREFSKEEKLNLIQLGGCRLYEEVGWTKRIAIDRDGWPVYQQSSVSKSMPEQQKKLLLMDAALKYFETVFKN